MSLLSKLFDPGQLAEGVSKLKSPLALVIYLITVVVICVTLVIIAYLSFREAQMQLLQDQEKIKEAQNVLVEKTKEADVAKGEVDDDIKDRLQEAYIEFQKEKHEKEIMLLKLDLRVAALEKESEKYGFDIEKMREEEAKKRLDEAERKRIWRERVAYADVPTTDPPPDGPGPVKEDKVEAYVKSAIEEDEAPEESEPIMKKIEKRVAAKKMKFKKARKVDWSDVPKVEQRLVESAD